MKHFTRLFTGGFFATAFFVFGSANAAPVQMPASITEIREPTGDHAFFDGDIVMGDKSAPNILISYLSSQCFHCIDFFVDELPKLEPLIKQKKLVFVLREFPTTPPPSDIKFWSRSSDLVGYGLARCASSEDRAEIIADLHEQKEQFRKLNDDEIAEAYFQLRISNTKLFSARHATLTQLLAKRLMDENNLNPDTFNCVRTNEMLEFYKARTEQDIKDMQRNSPAHILNGKIVTLPELLANLDIAR